MLHIYQGNGKGKTTCSVGLCVRAAGRKLPVLFAQFLKQGSSGEIASLKELETVTLLHPKCFYGFTFRMTEEEKEKTAEACNDMLRWVAAFIEQNRTETIEKDGNGAVIVRQLIILDEVLDAVNCGMVPEETITKLLDLLPENAEIVMTGRKATEAIAARADYITQFEVLKHPYQKGIPARAGVEF